jgi:hypothetical protein
VAPLNSSGVSVVHRHDTCSPLPSRDDSPSAAEILEREQERVDSIHRKVAACASLDVNTSSATTTAQKGTSLGTNNYITSLGLGTPARKLYAEIDTGSDLSWVQCKPCRDCYQQQDPLFGPAHSSTSPVPCGARECEELTPCARGCSSDNKCRYEYGYADGNLTRDTLTLGATDNKLPGFVFGCGDDDNGTFGETDGLFGLDRGEVSLASQAAARYGPGFSYCLPSSPSATGYLSLGVASALANARFTAMVTRSDHPSFYYVDLVSIKVAGRTLEIPPTAFEPKGTIIDSGSRAPWPSTTTRGRPRCRSSTPATTSPGARGCASRRWSWCSPRARR